MERILRYLERLIPQSAFGVTLLTISVMILVVGFFVGGLYLAGKPRFPEGYIVAMRDAPLSDDSVRLGPGDQYRTGPDGDATEPDVDPTAADDFDNRAFSTGPAAGTPAKPSAPYGTNQSRGARLVAPGYVAALVRTCDCRWAEDVEPPLEGQQFRVGQTLNVAAGLVEIAFACGAKAILEGPAVLELQSGKTSSLRSGRMTADVPDEVEGFTVHTPVVQVISLSTAEAQAVAKLSATANCLWADGSAATRDGANLRPGQAVKLTSGLAEITFGCGAKVILEGPANLEIESAKTAILHSGRLCADVPDDLEGFKIRTAVAEILSLPADAKPDKGVVLKPGEHVEITTPAKKTAPSAPPLTK